MVLAGRPQPQSWVPEVTGYYHCRFDKE
jgi:hypothetical protein